MSPDLVLINPGGGSVIYQNLDDEFTAIEPPLWCRLIAGYVKDRGHTVDILDAAADGDVVSRVGTPLLVCIAAYGHQPSASTQSMVSAGDIARRIKERNPDQRIILVGGHVSALPERTLAEEEVDYVCTGEGPVTVESLLSHLKEGASLETVWGLMWREGKNGPAPLIQNLSRDLHGNAWHLLPMDRYRAHNWQCFDGSPRTPYASIYTTLGCPYKCSFCCINAPFGGNRYRRREPAHVVAEIRQLHQWYGVKTLKIVDEMFVLNQRHYTEICEQLTKLPFVDDLNIWAYARVDTVKPETLSLLRRAGIRWLALGIESGSEHVRDGAEKHLNDDDIRSIVRTIQDAGINVIGNFIFGLPDDTRGSMQATLDLAKDLNCEFANFYSAMAYPGSALFNMADEKDLPERWSGYSQHSADTTPLPTKVLTSREVVDFRDQAFWEYFTDERYLEMIDRKFGSTVTDHIKRMVSLPLERAS